MKTLIAIFMAFGIPQGMYEDVEIKELHQDKYYDDLKVKGIYKDNVIYLYNGWTKATIVHELGHHICEKHNNPYPFGEPPYQYWKMNKQEDCAWTFASYYILKPNMTEFKGKLRQKYINIKKLHIQYK